MAGKGGKMLFAWIFLIVTILWVLNAFGVMAWNIPWMAIVFLILAVGMLVKVHTWKGK